MELKQVILGTEKVYCLTKESVNLNSKLFLIGFKDSLPVLSSMNPEEENLKLNHDDKTVPSETNATDKEKFIMFKGQKVKIIAESGLPKKFITLSQLNNTGIQSQFKVIKSIPLKESHTNLTSIILDKQITSEIKSNGSVIVNRFVKIPLSVTEHIKANTADKSIKADNMKMVKPNILDITGKPTLLNNLLNINKLNKQNDEQVALDLTIDNSKKTDSFVQVEIIKEEKAVQTDPPVETDIGSDLLTPDLDLDLNFLDLDIFNSFPSRTVSPMKKLLDLDTDRINDFGNSPVRELTTLTSVKNMDNCNMESNGNGKAERFFIELKNALLPDHAGNLPIHIAVLKNDFKAIKKCCFILKILKQTVNIPNSENLTPLQLAILHNASIEVIECLLQNDAQVDTADEQGDTVLHYAIQQNNIEAFKLLLGYAVNQNVNLNQHNHEGLTPLILCCLLHRTNFAELLLDSDADTEVRDQISGRTALFHAAELHHSDLVELLLQYHASTKTKNFFGTSTHDAMYEIEDIPSKIKYIILGKYTKRKSSDEPPQKFMKTTDKRYTLKTYARLQKIDDTTLNTYAKSNSKKVVSD